MKKKISPQKIIFIFTIFIVGLFVAQSLNYIINPLSTVKAVEASAEETVEISGFFVRNEDVLEIDTGEYTRFLATDGEKISKGSQVATVYSSTDMLTVSQELETVESRIELLEYAMNNTTSEDNTRLDQLIKTNMYSIADADLMDNNITAYISDLKTQLLKRNQTNLDADKIEDELSELEITKAALEKTLSSNGKMIYSSTSGYFVSKADGYENVLCTSEIDSYTYETINTIEALESYTYSKVINGFQWYFIANITAENVAQLSGKTSVNLRFSSIRDTIYEAKIYKLEVNEDGSAFLILECDKIDPELTTLREEDVSIILASYKGIKVPIDALRINNGVEGVYILAGPMATFKSIDIIYSCDDYYLAKNDKTTTKSIFIGDDIIANSKNISQSKIVQ